MSMRRNVLCGMLLAVSTICLGMTVNAEPLVGDEIISVQINTIKTPVKKFGELQALVDNINELTDEKDNLVYGIDRDDCMTLCFENEDGEKRLYRVYQILDKWYMEDEDGNIHPNADFLENYINTDIVDTVDTKTTIKFEEGETQKELNAAFTAYDLSYFFTWGVINFENAGCERQEAISSVKEGLKQWMLRLDYAKRMGHDPDEEELEIRKYKIRNKMEKASILNEDEIDLDAEFERGKEAFAAYCALEDLEKAVLDAFREGNDSIKGIACNNFTEYWCRFLQEVVYMSADEEEVKEIDQQLDAAEKVVIDYLSKE